MPSLMQNNDYVLMLIGIYFFIECVAEDVYSQATYGI